MVSLDFIAMGAFIVVAWAACAVAAGTVLWFTGVAGYGLNRAWNWLKPKTEEPAPRPHGRKHGRRAVPAATYEPVHIRRRVFPLV